MVNIFPDLREFKIPLIMLTFAITLKGINTLRRQSNDKSQDMISRVQRGKLSWHQTNSFYAK